MSGIPVIVRSSSGDKALLVSPSNWDGPASQFHEALASRVGRDAAQFDIVVERTGRVVVRTDSAEVAGIRAGDVLMIEPVRSVTEPGPAAVASLEATAGPHKGTRWAVPEGTHTIGRGEAATVRLAGDEAASRVHATLTLRSGSAKLFDPGSLNGTTVDGTPIEDEVELRDGSVLEVGDSTLVVHLADDRLGAHLSASSGRLLFNRPPRFVEPNPAIEFPVDSPPDTPPKRRVPLAAAVVPLLFGVVMASVMGQPMFLLFTLMSPIMVVGSFIEDRRTGRADFRKSSAEWIEQLRTTADDVADTQLRAVEWRRRRWPSPELVIADISSSSSRLWQRRPSDDDFGDLRVGVSELPSDISVDLADGGAAELRSQALRLVESAAVDKDVPVAVSLRELGVVGLVGDDQHRSEMLRWLVVQLAAHQSPRDLDLVVLGPHDLGDVEWASWLPHAFPPGAAEPSIAVDADHSRKLFAAVRGLIESRRAESKKMVGSRKWTPLVVLVVVAPLDVSAREVSELLSDAADQGLAVIWSCRRSGELPNECTAVISISGDTADLTFTGGSESVRRFQPDRLDRPQTESLARSLAPLVDVTAGSGASDLPDSVPLPDVIGRDALDSEGLLRRWADRPAGLSAPVGISSAGTHYIDLVADGPHGMLVGMTGAGKSGVLQAVVGSIAATHPTDAVNFMFVDFKGGAGFGPLIELPHSVGLVTDLDARMARRALVSLQAELHRREVITKEAGVEGIRDLNKLRPGAMPHLVIFVDEFAKLKAEVPEFIDGLVDVAQRGRSLGVHLLLAAQEAGKIDESLKSNSNLKIALRVDTPAGSTDVIGRPDAAFLPESAPGRGVVKAGHRLETVQFGYGGGATHLEVDGASVAPEARTIMLGRNFAPGGREVDPTDTDLHRLVQACREAVRRSGADEVYRPWMSPLPTVIDLDSLTLSGGGKPLNLLLGLLDESAKQRQVPWCIDLATCGSVAVFGSSGSGLTTFLRTVAISVAKNSDPDQVHVYAFDFASRGLGSLTRLPHCGDVVVSDNLDRVRRLIAMLADEAERRREILGRTGGGSIADLQDRGDIDVPAIVVLIDGYGAFWAALEPIDQSEHLETVQQLIAEGRALGLHFVLTADRRGAVPPTVSSTVGLQLVMRLANPDEYSSLGRPDLAKVSGVCSGRVFTTDGLEAQVAVLGDNPSAEGQISALSQLAAQLIERWSGAGAPAVRVLPDHIDLEALGAAPTPTALPIGVDERRGEPVMVDVVANPYFFVAGPDGSGRTTALAALASSFMASPAQPGREVWWATTRGTSAVPPGRWATRATRADEVATMVTAVVAEIGELEASGDRVDRLIVIDDADELADPSFQAPIDQMVRRGRDVGIAIAVSMSTYRASSAFNQWVKSFRAQRHGLLLQPDLTVDGDIFSMRLPRRAGLALPPGRACLVTRRGVSLIQVATPPSSG